MTQESQARMEMSEYLRFIRERAGLSIEDVGVPHGISKQQLSVLERSDREIFADTVLMAYSQATGISIENIRARIVPDQDAWQMNLNASKAFRDLAKASALFRTAANETIAKAADVLWERRLNPENVASIMLPLQREGEIYSGAADETDAQIARIREQLSELSIQPVQSLQNETTETEMLN